MSNNDVKAFIHHYLQKNYWYTVLVVLYFNTLALLYILKIQYYNNKIIV